MFVCFFVDERWNQIDLSKNTPISREHEVFVSYLIIFHLSDQRVCDCVWDLVLSILVQNVEHVYLDLFETAGYGILEKNHSKIERASLIIKLLKFSEHFQVSFPIWIFSHLDLSNHHVSTQTFQVNTLKKVFCPIPRCSMLLEYLPTKLRHFWGKCRCAYCSTTLRIWDS